MTQAIETLDRVRYNTQKVGDLDIFYREAGDPSRQAVVLLHGFPSSSHMYREVLSALGNQYYLIAPDYPGFGESSMLSAEDYTYTFDNLAETINQFLVERELNDYVLMIHDYGAPVGFRIATKHPEKVKGFIVMNGNAYEDGLGEMVMQSLQQERTLEAEAAMVESTFNLQAIKWQYTHGTRIPESISPDNWNLDAMKITREGADKINVNLLFDYPSNVKLYPQWQQYLRDTQPPMLITWGKNDPFFIESGAEAYKRDVKEIDYNILDTGHFPLEEDSQFIIAKMRDFLKTIK
ncbi:MAG: alpha/beta fold hydrolase [Leptolyngbyaceae cyanobacterium]